MGTLFLVSIYSPLILNFERKSFRNDHKMVSHKLAHLPLRPSTLATLEKRGFVSTGELEESKSNGGMSNLAAELGCSPAEAASLMREVKSAIASVSPQEDGEDNKHSATALSLISKLKTTHKTIVTFSRAVDSMLGGGLAKGEVTEIAGLPGVGKTQLSMQLCVDASLPTTFGGVAGESVYIDTEGSFSPERCFTMAKVSLCGVLIWLFLTSF